MTASKIAISLPEELVDHLRRVVKKGSAPSVSAYVAKALERQKQDEDLRTMLDEVFAQTGGPPAAAERAATRRKMGLPPRRRAKR